jgi:ribonuclease HII
MDWYFHEILAAQKGYNTVCGIDEAGRGPLAGPVYAAAVILPYGLEIAGINDSKKLSENKREALFDIITSKALAFCIASADEHEIDEINILNATFLAMRRAFDGLDIKPDAALVDGNQDPKLDMPSICIVKGDAASASIAAASILAKVSRDRFMLGLDVQYPQYAFSQHKGYPTKQHYVNILKYGISPVHRISFLKNIEEKRAFFENIK